MLNFEEKERRYCNFHMSGKPKAKPEDHPRSPTSSFKSPFFSTSKSKLLPLKLQNPYGDGYNHLNSCKVVEEESDDNTMAATTRPGVLKSEAVSKGYNFASTWEQVYDMTTLRSRFFKKFSPPSILHGFVCTLGTARSCYTSLKILEAAEICPQWPEKF
uniref:Uncharacterized protein n=1 Tax=Solanum lycopersicum TaxID=4081 RepID=A0A3Q7H929_SOLLC